MVERALAWYGRAYDLSWTALRYFNAAGADPEGELGEAHDPETHLIPLALAVAHGDASFLQVFGSDYETPDGTAVRDYVHVTDLACAHVRALCRLAHGGSSGTINLGTGRGCSVREVIAQVERITGQEVPTRACPRRVGDPPVLVAEASLALRELGWVARHSSLEEIVETHWRWFTRSHSPV
jgi:UDP-arabinose 4-epimerase